MNNETMNNGGTAVSRRFVRGLRANLNYWCRETADLNDDGMRELNPDFSNLLCAVEIGLLLPETQRQTAELILQCFFWIEGAGHIHRWQPVVREMAAVLPEREVRLRFRLLKQLGQFQQLQWNLDESISTFHAAWKLADRLEDKQATAEIHYNLSQVHRTKHLYEQASTHAQTVLDLLENKPLRFRALAMQALGQIAQEQGNLTEAETWLRRALTIPYETKTITDLTRTMNALAVVLQQQGNFADALRVLQEISILLKDTINSKDKVEAYMNQGSLYYEQGNLDQAELAFKAARDLLQDSREAAFYKGLIANNLGCISRDRREWVAADTYFRQSVMQFRQIGNDLMLANSLGNSAKSNIRQGLVREAQLQLNEALQLVAKYPDNAWARSLQTQYSTMKE